MSFTFRRLSGRSSRPQLPRDKTPPRLEQAGAGDLAAAGTRSATSTSIRTTLSIRMTLSAMLVGLVALVGFSILAPEASAHSRLVKSDPAARAVLATAPKELKLWFNEAIEVAFAKIWLVSADGSKAPLANHGDASDPRLLIVTLPDNLAPGPVVIEYRVLSVDGHVVESQLTFNVKNPA